MKQKQENKNKNIKKQSIMSAIEAKEKTEAYIKYKQKQCLKILDKDILEACYSGHKYVFTRLDWVNTLWMTHSFRAEIEDKYTTLGYQVVPVQGDRLLIRWCD